MSEDTQVLTLQQALKYIQELKQKLLDSERKNQQLVKQIQDQKCREAETQPEKQWLQKKINTLEEKQEACEKMEAGEKQIRQLKKLVGEHEETRKQLEEQVQQFQDKVEEYQRMIDILKKTEESVTQLKCSIDKQHKQRQKLESRLQEEICRNKQLQEQLVAVKQSAVMPQKTIQDMKWHKESNAPDGTSKGSAALIKHI